MKLREWKVWKVYSWEWDQKRGGMAQLGQTNNILNEAIKFFFILLRTTLKAMLSLHMKIRVFGFMR